MKADAYLTHTDLADRLAFKGKKKAEAARKWALRKGLPRTKRSDSANAAWLYRAVHVEEALARAPFSKLT